MSQTKRLFSVAVRNYIAQFDSICLSSIKTVERDTTTMDKRNNPQNILRAVLGILLLFSKTEAFSLVGTTSTRTAIRNRQSTQQKTILASPIPSQHRSPLILNGFLGGIFGNSNSENNIDVENGVLSIISVGDFDDSTIQVRYDSLSDYITDKWMDLFETKSIALTTPVKVFKRYEGRESDAAAAAADDDDDATISERACCKLVFQKVDTGYNDKDGDDEDGNNTPSKDDEPKQGGVEMEVQKLASNKLRVVARRCEIDEDTMIKEMSEELILKELQKAIHVWKKETL